MHSWIWLRLDYKILIHNLVTKDIDRNNLSISLFLKWYCDWKYIYWVDVWYFSRHSDITISWLDKCRSYFKWIFHGKRTKTTHFCKICITKEEETSFKFLRRKFFVGHYVPSCFVLPFNTIHTKTCMIILIMHCRHTTSICLGTPSCFV